MLPILLAQLTMRLVLRQVTYSLVWRNFHVLHGFQQPNLLHERFER